MEQKLLDTLKEYWHYDSFRPMQREIIESVLAGRDTLALLPTGGGKSITFQLPTLLREGLCIVVTPLISLMKDQVDALRRRGIPAVAIHSGLSARQIDIALDNCVFGDIKFLYIAPERLESEIFRMRVSRMEVSLLAIDEAHCISQWGYDFRPSYLRIAGLRELLPSTPILALTASATPRVTKDIMEQLHFGEPNILQGSFARPNLSYSVRTTEDKEWQLMRIILHVPGCGIVYVRRREQAETLSKILVEAGVSATFYHGGLPAEERALRQESWINNDVRVMVATSAFGMGIDKSDVRFVVHFSMPDSLESYYQEAGRAGRDGKRSYAVLLRSSEDEWEAKCAVRNEFPSLEVVRNVYENICAMHNIAIGDGKGRSVTFNIHDLQQRVRYPIHMLVSSLKLLHLNGYMTYIDEYENPARMLFTISRDELYHLRHEGKEEEVINSVLRLFPGVFSELRKIDVAQVANMIGTTYEVVHETLRQLRAKRIINYISAYNTPILFFDEERLPTRDVRIAPETYALRKELMIEYINKMLQYAYNDNECRHRFIEQYFCESVSEPCGICDICIAKRKERGEIEPVVPTERILELVGDGEISIKELVIKISGNEDDIVEGIKQLVREERLELNGTILKRGAKF